MRTPQKQQTGLALAKRGDAYRYVRVDVCSQELVEADKELAEV
jgi:hypothetical protein